MCPLTIVDELRNERGLFGADANDETSAADGRGAAHFEHRQRVREMCDMIVDIDMVGACLELACRGSNS